MAEEAKAAQQRNWADEDDDGNDEGEDVEIGGSSVAQVGKPAAEGEAATEGTGEAAAAQAPPQKPKPRTVRERNIHGDFVVTKIHVKETKVVIPQAQEEENEEEESEEESEEEPPRREEPEEEEKKGK